jgi:hypothetical protein
LALRSLGTLAVRESSTSLACEEVFRETEKEKENKAKDKEENKLS